MLKFMINLIKLYINLKIIINHDKLNVLVLNPVTT